MTAAPGGGHAWFDRAHIESFLRGLGAGQMDHPGGTLLRHLCRVTDLVTAWGGGQALQAAALCHACYGTDGYPQSLLPLTERARLAGLIGAGAEALVYRYASCDRALVYPQLGVAGQVRFRDRFTGQDVTVAADELRPFMELTAANELDALAHDPDLATAYGPGLLEVFTRARGLLTTAAWQACQQRLGAGSSQAPARDHLDRES